MLTAVDRVQVNFSNLKLKNLTCILSIYLIIYPTIRHGSKRIKSPEKNGRLLKIVKTVRKSTPAT